MGRIRDLFEDALKIKIVPKEDDFSAIKVTSNREDLTTKQIEDAGNGSLIDMDAINKFRTLSTDRQEKYSDYENLLSDATIAAAIEMYADDSTQYDYRTGKIIWAESEEPEIAKAANRLIDVLGINDNAWTHIYALCTYGDVYLRLYRKGDISDYTEQALTQIDGQTSVRVKPQDESRKMEEYVEYVDDPATMYDLQIKGKTAGFIRMINSEVENSSSYYASIVNKTLDLQDVNMYDRTSFVHICLSGNIDRHPELITLTNSEKGTVDVYKVKSGKSILADAYEASQTVKLLEDSMMLSRVTKSALVRILQIEVGDMPKSEVEALLRRVKNMIEQKMALNKTNGVISSYNSPGPIENVVYFPTKNGRGAITSNNLGGDVNIKDIVDIDYFNNKKLSALKIPKQYLNYDAPEGLGNGTSLTKLSSRYAHTIMRIQNAYISGITTLLNLFFMDKDLKYINKFKLKMVSPATIEDTERDEQVQNRLNQTSDILSLMDERISDKGKIEVVDWLLNNFLNLPDLSEILREYSLLSGEESTDSEQFGHDVDFDSPMSGMGGPDIDMGGPDVSFEMGAETESEPSFEAGPDITPEA